MIWTIIETSKFAVTQVSDTYVQQSLFYYIPLSYQRLSPVARQQSELLVSTAIEVVIGIMLAVGLFE